MSCCAHSYGCPVNFVFQVYLVGKWLILICKLIKGSGPRECVPSSAFLVENLGSGLISVGSWNL